MKLTNLIKSDLIKNISSLSLIQIANYVVPLILIPYISRIVGVDNYGKLEYARSLVLYFTIFIDYGFNYTATRDISSNRNNQDKLNEIFSQIFLSKIILFIIASIAFYGLIQADQSLIEIKTVLFATYIINIGFVLFPIWFFQGIEKIAFISIINFIIKIALLALTLIFLKQKSDYWIYNFLQSIAQIVAGVFSIIYALKRFNVRFVKVDFHELFKKLKEGFPIFISTLLVSIIASFSFIVLKENVDNETLGIYSTAFKLVITIQTLLLVPFSQAFFPYMINLASKDILAFKKKIKQASFLIIGLNLVIIVFCYIFAELIIQILFGKQYIEAVEPFRSFLLLPLFASLTNLFSYQGLLTLKRDRAFLMLHICFAALTVLTSLYFIPIYGMYGTIILRISIEFGLCFSSFLLYVLYINRQVSTIKPTNS